MLLVQRFRRSKLLTFNLKMKPELTWRKRLGKSYPDQPSTSYSSENFKKQIRVYNYLRISITVFITKRTNFYLKLFTDLYVGEPESFEATWHNTNIRFILHLDFNNGINGKCFHHSTFSQITKMFFYCIRCNMQLYYNV